MNLWKEICVRDMPDPRFPARGPERRALGCDFSFGLDLTAVPYFVHRDDLEAIAPVWRKYIILLHEWVQRDEARFGRKRPAVGERYRGIDLYWNSEMLAYNFAAAQLKVRHVIEARLQIRDVDGP